MPSQTAPIVFASLPVRPGLEAMEARSAERLPQGEGWSYEPKWDGFRCLAFRDGDEVELQAKSGKSLGRFFPEVVARLRALAPDRFVLDGELMIAGGGSFDFDGLQARLHPAESRIRKLSVETPATYVLFDMLVSPNGEDLMARPLRERRAELERFVASIDDASLSLSPTTTDLGAAQAWLASTGAVLDGVVAKRTDGVYAAGERAMVKVKRLRSADCVVGGFRYGEGSRRVGSLLLGLYDDGRLHHVGFCSGLADADKPELTARLEALIEAPGFDGRAPGGPSRWSPNARPIGSRSAPNSSSKCASTTSPAAASATARASCAGAPTSRRTSAPTTKCGSNFYRSASACVRRKYSAPRGLVLHIATL